MREIQKENLFFFLFPSASIFGEAKDTNKWEKYKRKTCFSFYFKNNPNPFLPLRRVSCVPSVASVASAEATHPRPPPSPGRAPTATTRRSYIKVSWPSVSLLLVRHSSNKFDSALTSFVGSDHQRSGLSLFSASATSASRLFHCTLYIVHCTL